VAVIVGADFRARSRPHQQQGEQERCRKTEIYGRRQKQRSPGIPGGCLPTIVAGAGYAECYTAPKTHWIDLR
jgi:hypothetical protein